MPNRSTATRLRAAPVLAITLVLLVACAREERLPLAINVAEPKIFIGLLIGVFGRMGRWDELARRIWGRLRRLHAKMRENWGFPRLAAVARKESIEEMEDADKLIERILYLDGVPNLQRLNSVGVGETVPEQLELDLEQERSAIGVYNRAITVALAHNDNGTREMLAEILVGEEAHADWLESQLELIRHSPHDDADLLKHFLGVRRIGQQGDQVREQPPVVLGE